MAKAKVDTANAEKAETLDDRISLFFQVQPYGENSTLADLMTDISDKELAAFVTKDTCDSILKRLTNDKIDLPKTKDGQYAMARTKEVQAAIDRLVKAGTLEKVKIEEKGEHPTDGYHFIGERPANTDAEGEVKRMPIDRIRVNEKRYQLRAGGTNPARVESYRKVADRLPPVDVYEFEGEDKVDLVGGFHRFPAMVQAGFDMVPVIIHKGTKEDALLFAIRQNAAHGAQRTMDDIKTAVGAFLSMPGRKNTAIAAIARAVDCAWGTAEKCQKHWFKLWNVQKSETVVGGDNKERPATIKPEDTTNPNPDVTAPGEAPAPPEVVVLDKMGTPCGDINVAHAFTDTRFLQAINDAIKLQNFLREVRPDGYALSSIPYNERVKMLNEVEFTLAQLQASVPYAVTPSDAKEVDESLAGAVRRGWMDKAEYGIYNAKVNQSGTAAEATVTSPADSSKPNGKGKGRKKKAAEATEAVQPAAQPDAAPETAPADSTSHVRGSEEGTAQTETVPESADNVPANAA